VRWKWTGRLIEALTREPAWWGRPIRWHAESAGRSSWKRCWAPRKAALRTKAVVEGTAGTTRAAEGRIASRWKLDVWRKVRRRWMLALLILRAVLVPRLCLWCLTQTLVLAAERDETLL
jgi:hypothetical protein